MPKSHLDAALTGHHLLKVIIVPKSIKAADSLKSFKISLSDLGFTDNILKGILRAYLPLCQICLMVFLSRYLCIYFRPFIFITNMKSLTWIDIFLLYIEYSYIT